MSHIWEKASVVLAVGALVIGTVRVMMEAVVPEVRCFFGLSSELCPPVSQHKPKATSPPIQPIPQISKGLPRNKLPILWGGHPCPPSL